MLSQSNNNWWRNTFPITICGKTSAFLFLYAGLTHKLIPQVFIRIAQCVEFANTPS